MLEITIDGVNVKIKGSGDKGEVITDATLAVVSMVEHLHNELNISREEAFARLSYTVESALKEYRVDVLKNESVHMPNLDRYMKK